MEHLSLVIDILYLWGSLYRGRPSDHLFHTISISMATETKKNTKTKDKEEFTKETYLTWYETMLLIRRFEERALMEYGRQNIRGFLHVYIGQEAIAAGMKTALRNEDPVVTGYRQHGIALMKGVSADACMAELWGKKTGVVKGKGGSMHFFSKEHHYFGGNGIVAAQIPIGTGIGFAEKYRETDNVSICMFGDGAARQGALYESFNMAKTWNLPVLYVCENNNYAMGTSVERTSSLTDIYKVGNVFDIPSKAVDGMDPVAVHQAFKEAADSIRAGNGPHFLEVETYRYKGHSVSDPAKYRTKEELKSYQDKDPVKVLEKKLKEEQIATEDEIKQIKSKIKDTIEASVKFAQESEYPDPSELYDDNYIEDDYPFLK